MNMKNKGMLILVVFCLLILPTKAYGATQNSISYITKGELDKVYSSNIVIHNTYGDLQPGEYFTIQLIGAEFEMDPSGNPKISSYNVEFDKRSKTSVIGRLLENVQDQKEVSIHFTSKILSDKAEIEIDGEDSHITSGTYTYAITSDADLSYEGEVEVGKAAPFYDFIELDPMIIREQYNGAFRSLQIYKYDIEELIKVEIPKDEYEFYDREFSYPIAVVVQDINGDETRYELGRDIEVNLSSDRSTLTFKQYNQDILQPTSGVYTIRIENLRLKATKANRKQDVYVTLGGKWVEEQEVLIGKQITDPLVIQASEKEMKPGESQRVQFILQEAKTNTILTEKEISFGLTDGIKIDFKDNFKLSLVDGVKTYNQGQSSFKVDKNGHSFTIEDFTRDTFRNLIRIEGEFTAQVPRQVDKDIQFFVSDLGIRGVFYSTVFTGYEKYYTPKVEFTINKDVYTIDGIDYPIDAKPYISIHNRIMVPFRYVAYALGVDSEDLKWDGPSQTITLQGDQSMTINVTTGEMVVNGKVSTLSETSLTGGRTFVPVGEIARAFGTQVQWNAESRTAIFN